MPLPTNIAGSYPDRGPGDTAHQEHHDAIHAAVNEVTEGRLTEAALSATYVGQGRVPADRQRADRDHAYRTWDTLMADPDANPALHVLGHSVVAGTGATDPPHTFARILKSRVEGVRTGAVVTKHGLAGYSTTEMLAATPDADFTGHAAGSVGCLVIMAMLNDYSEGVDPATTQANLQQIIAAYRADAAAADNMTVVIAAEWLRQTASGGYPWTDYIAAAEAVAEGDEYVTVVNLYERMGQAQGDTLGLYSDGTHPTDKGHALVANLLYADLVRVTPERPIAPSTILPCIIPPVASSGWRNYTTPVAGAAIYGNYLRSSDGAQGASFTYQFVGDAGFYTIGLGHRRGSDRGKYDLYIDGELQGTGGSWDGYNSTVQDTVQEVSGFSVKKSGLHTLQFVMASKHASSTGYIGAYSVVTATRTGPLTS